jgi:hypothetical protein
MRAPLLLSLLLSASPALAIDCAAPDLMEAVRAAADAPDRLRLLHGYLRFDAALLPPLVEADILDPPPLAVPEPVDATFDGLTLNLDGTTTGLDAEPITLHPSCSGVWCGSVRPDVPLVLLAQRTPEGLALELGACGGTAYWDVGPEELAGVLACLRSGACDES